MLTTNGRRHGRRGGTTLSGHDVCHSHSFYIIHAPVQNYTMYNTRPSGERFPRRKQPCKLFLFNLAKCVTDEDLQGIFSPYQPIYATVALGKRGASRVRCLRH